jgi:N-acetylneuraminate lyase
MSAGAMDATIAAFVIDDLAAATFTPYAGASVGGVAGGVDLAAVEAHCADLAAHGVRFAFINGTTGDSMCLTQAERRGLHEAWVKAGRAHGVKVLAHVGSSSIAEACELAAHAQASGCDAICAMAPSFFKPRDAHALALWLQAIGAAAPKLPLYYYNFPIISGVDINPLALIQQLEAVGVPTFRGMKFTDFNLWFYSNCVAYAGGKYDIAYGRDEAMLGGLATGARGSIGNGFNFAAGVYQRLRRAFFAGDLEAARLEQRRANLTIDMMNSAKYGGNGLATSRRMYEMKGTVKLGPPRAPIFALSAEQDALLKADLDACGFFSWADDARGDKEGSKFPAKA